MRNGGWVPSGSLGAAILVFLACAAAARAETLQWAHKSAVPTIGYGVVLGPDGSPHVAGATSTLRDALLRKFSAAGDTVWTRRYRGAAAWDDEAFGVAVSRSGSVYVTGYFHGADLSETLLLRKYSAAGDLVWSRPWRPSWASGVYGAGVAVGPDGGVYVAGRLERVGSGRGQLTSDMLLQKYSAGGRLLWTRLYNGPLDRDDAAAAVAVGADGSVYVAGATEAARTNYNVLVQRYTAGGALVWTRTYDGPAKFWDFGYGVAVGADGGVYVTGALQAELWNYDMLLRKYTADGAVVWTRRLDGASHGGDGGAGVAVGPDGSVFVAGVTTVPGAGGNVLVRKYSPAGDLLWSDTYNTAVDDDDRGLGVAVGGDGSVYVTGAVRAALSEDGPDYLLLLKYK